MICQLVFQPVIRLVQIVVSVVEWILIGLCQLIEQLVKVVTEVLEWVCKSVVQTICGAVCSIVCGICEFFCGIFGCDCGCERVCRNICNVVTNVVCGWTYVLKSLLKWATTLVCRYILQALLALLNLVEAIVTMVLTWVCSLAEVLIRWFLCWIYVADIFNNTDPRWLKVAPKIIRNSQGYSDWFVCVNNPNADGSVDQVQLYVLSDEGRPLLPVVERESGEVAYYEVETRGNHISGHLRREHGGLVRGRPLLYYAYKVIEISSHLLGDVFAGQPGDDGRGTDYRKNLLTYNPHAQDWLASDGQLPGNNYNRWGEKYTNKGAPDYFGDGSLADMGMRVDTDSTCSHPTNAFLHLVNGQVEFTPCDTAIAEEMSCGAGPALTFDQTNFLMLNKDADSSAVTTYLVSRFESDEAALGCNDLLGYTIVNFHEGDQPRFVKMRVLPYERDTNAMMTKVVENIAPQKNFGIVRAAESYLHECGHQCGLLHDTDAPDCENDTTLHITKLMDPYGFIRRAYTRNQWCMVRTSPYMTSRPLEPFTQAPELPASSSEPPASEPPASSGGPLAG